MERYYGKLVVLRKNDKGDPLVSIGPRWFIFFLTFLVIFILNYILLFEVKINNPLYWLVRISCLF